MITSNKKICLIYCGALGVMDARGFHAWIKNVPELGIVARLRPLFLYGESTADITPRVWVEIAQAISTRYKKYDGFVIMHGFDNLLYTASAVSFLLQNISKPIIFTGGLENALISKISPTTKNISLKANLINALQLSTFPFQEVGLVFGSRFIRASQSHLSKEGSLNFYDAPIHSALGKLDFSIRIFEKNMPRYHGQFQYYKTLDDNIEVFKVNPFTREEQLVERLADRDGIIFNLSYFSDIPSIVLGALDKLKQKIPAVLFWSYEKEVLIKERNIIIPPRMTFETTVTKFMWALAQTKDFSKLRKLMHENIAHEIL